jgi:ketosteroid isomerase-like protein
VDEEATIEAVERFNAAVASRDVDAIMATMTDDCVWETTTPPDGGCFEGQAAVRKALEEFYASSPVTDFETEELFACGDRATMRWIYRFGDGHVRGVDVLKVRDGKVAEMLAYVKG